MKSLPNLTISQNPPQGSGEDVLARQLGLRRLATDALTIKRVRRGKGFCYFSPDGTPIRDPRVRRRLSSLAVPPAYRDVHYAADPAAHLRAVGRDAAGRLQYTTQNGNGFAKDAKLNVCCALPILCRTFAAPSRGTSRMIGRPVNLRSRPLSRLSLQPRSGLEAKNMHARMAHGVPRRYRSRMLSYRRITSSYRSGPRAENPLRGNYSRLDLATRSRSSATFLASGYFNTARRIGKDPFDSSARHQRVFCVQLPARKFRSRTFARCALPRGCSIS